MFLFLTEESFPTSPPFPVQFQVTSGCGRGWCLSHSLRSLLVFPQPWNSSVSALRAELISGHWGSCLSTLPWVSPCEMLLMIHANSICHQISLSVAIISGFQCWQWGWSTSRSTSSLLQMPPGHHFRAHFLHSWWESPPHHKGSALWVGRGNDSSVSVICRQFKFSHVEEISESSHKICAYGSPRFEEESLLSALPQAQGRISFIQHINSINHGIVWLQSGRITLL